MKSDRFSIRIVVAAVLLTGLASDPVTLSHSQVLAQEAASFQVYRLTQTSPTDARRMLTELLGEEAKGTQIVADAERSELLVSGSDKSQQLARQLVQKLNAPPKTASTKKSSLEVRSYPCRADRIDEQFQKLRSALSASAGVSADHKGERIVVAGNASDQRLAEQLLNSSLSTDFHDDAPPTELFPEVEDWVSVPENAEGRRPRVGSPSKSAFLDAEFPNEGAKSNVSALATSNDDMPRNRATQKPGSDAFSPKDFGPDVAQMDRPALQSSGSRPGRLSLLASHSPSSTTNTTEPTVETFRFRNVSVEQAELALKRLLGTRVDETEPHRFTFSAGRRRQVTIEFDRDAKSCDLTGPTDLVTQFSTLLKQFDDARDQEVADAIRFMPLNNIDPDVLSRALIIWKRSNQDAHNTQPSPEQRQDQKQGARVHRDSMIRRAGFQQVPGEPAIPIDPPEDSRPAATSEENDVSPDNRMRRPSSDVTVEPLQDLDVLILRGRDPDVEELTRIIREIERLSAETAPDIEVVYLHNVRGEALEELVSEVLDDLTGPLQGRVSLTPLITPNAVLLIGWGEAVNAAKKLIARLDEPVEPSTQMQMFSLKHASANQVETTIQQFLSNRGGLGPEVNITADPRTNTVIVNAAPRDLQEVTKLIERLDAGTSESVNQARVIQLKNALAADVSQTITQAITAARGGTGTQRSAALEMLMTGPDGKSVAASGLLEDVRLTPDVRTNRIFITGPPDSVPLVEQLIRSLDESPAAAAQIKVFQITNGDATDLVQVLRSLFPEQAAVSTVPQLATAEGESALVPVRFSVDVRTNSIIATGTSGDLRIIEVLLLRLDEADSQERVNEVYRLKNSPALDVANAVNSFLRSERVVNQAAPGRQNPFAQIESEVVVVPEPVGNALIISATPRYFEQIMELVEGLDAQPPQVMIQVILAEVELDNRHEFGVELGLQDSLLFDRSLMSNILTPGFDFNNKPLGNSSSATSLATAGNVGGQALSHFALGRVSDDTDFGGMVLSASSENVSVLLRAMNQSRSLEILSRPQIMTLDNQPAFIQVGQRVPRIVGTSINQVGQVNTVELENVGLILGVTPRISPEGMVVMEIDAEKSEVGPEIEGIPVSTSADGTVIRSPRVNITTAQTTVSSASGQTIVIGGLITTSNTSLSRRVPWLSDVPVLGHLFRFDGNRNQRKELLIILTPHVVRGPSEAEYIKQVEMARMSWISCDIFNWMNTDTTVTGQLDSLTVPTIYPDQTPGAPALQQLNHIVMPVPAADDVPNQTETNATPEWKIESLETSEPADKSASQIRQMSFQKSENSDARKSAVRKKEPTLDSQKDDMKPQKTKPKEQKKRLWSRN